MRGKANLEIFKEPRGFIKIVQIGIAIFAFSTTAGYYSEFKVDSFVSNANTTTCTNHSGEQALRVLAKFEYPFDNEVVYMDTLLPQCVGNKTVVHKSYRDISGKYKSESQFFVFTGVATFLYCLVACLYYAMFENSEESMYSTDVGKFSFVVIDFIISVVLVIFWFSGSVVWASALSELKDDTNPDSFVAHYKFCQPDLFNCTIKKEPNYATLKVSIILGFLNLFVWLGNLWFLFKETPWHNPRQGMIHDTTTQ